MSEPQETETPPSSIAKSRPGTRTQGLIVVSNRLPVSLKRSGGKLQAAPSSGGLASALAGVQADEDIAWVGWPGCEVPRAQREDVNKSLHARRLFPVHLSRTQEAHYYHGICNQVLWPLFHYFTDRVSFRPDSWRHYVEVNRRFADAVLEQAAPGARVWVHDFHLMLLPGMLRAERPDLEIGFFLHIPFPSSEIYKLLPVREELLRGLLGADYLGFHTHDYVRHFRSSCLRVLGVGSKPNAIKHEARRVGIGTNPIGISVARFREVLGSDQTGDLIAELEHRYRNRKVILGVERLDYTKGIPLKLQAFERFLARYPERAKDVTLLQVIVPSRLSHPDYRQLKSEIEEAVGRINGKYGGPGITPVEYMHRNLTPEQLVALYRFVDVGLVTPVRDGMNLVAQEFVLCQSNPEQERNDKGILVLSEFAGAAHYLGRSLLVNPWDIEQTADALAVALDMSAKEKSERMTAMAEQVVELDCQRWATGFLDKLEHFANKSRERSPQKRLDRPQAEALRDRFWKADRRIVALDYDGTLRELTRRPIEASPTDEILDLLLDLASLPDTEVHLVSGRPVETMQDWFGTSPIHLCAEHGYKARVPGFDWRELHRVDLSWMPMVEETLKQVQSEVPGTVFERKSCALAWHYRMADLDYGTWRARELRSTLEEDLANLPVEVISGHYLIEVRASGVHKGSYIDAILSEADPGTMMLCAGDDRTDLDMYRALPADAVSIHVGSGGGETTYTIDSPAQMRELLRQLVDGAPVTHRARQLQH